ncbi:MAG: substrate-binding domain-containing protein [Blautia sp.]|nr:substrate-binding domain-containing protein [Blautia sp.]
MNKRVMSAVMAAALTAGLFSVNTTAFADDNKYCYYFPAAHAYADESSKAAQEYADENGLDFKVFIGSDWEQETQDTNMRALVADGYTSILAYPSTDGAAGLFEELQEAAGANIITYGGVTTQETERFGCATDVEAAAYEACADVIEAIGGEGGVLDVLEQLNDTNTLKRQKGINQCIEDHPGAELVQEVAGINNVEEGVEKISAALAANADKIDGIVTTGNQASSAAVQVMNDYYDRNPDAKKIVLITIDTPNDVMEGIESGVVYGTIAQNVNAHVQVPLKILMMLNDGWTKREGTFFIDTGCVLVTKENVDSYQEDLDKVTERIFEEIPELYLEKN